MNSIPAEYTPSIDLYDIRERLSHLLVEGEIADPDLHRRVARLDERFRTYASTFPYGLWAPGLAVSREEAKLTELYLPMGEIRRAISRLFAVGVRSGYPPQPFVFSSAANWLDCLGKLPPKFRRVNPADLVRVLMADETLRLRFVFSVMLPGKHGGSFGRYPEQLAFIRDWVRHTRSHLDGTVRCLDAACGTGEGTYELAQLLVDEGIDRENLVVHGSTLEPVELFAAAHCYFPHDAEREREYRRRISPLIVRGITGRLRFVQEDVRQRIAGSYDVILCNGLLGGPAVHERDGLKETVQALSGRLRLGGILLVANRFHDGWKKRSPKCLLAETMEENGLKALSLADGVVGVKKRVSGALKLDEDPAPGKPTAEPHHQDHVPRLDDAVPEVLVQGEPH